ncbi:hypothetical protein LINPERPRIM_LOCUS35192 [Linum perenne]
MAVRISPPSILLGTWLRCRCIRCLCCSRQPIPCHRFWVGDTDPSTIFQGFVEDILACFAVGIDVG